MVTAVPTLAQLLDEPSRFAVFATSLLGRGWVTDVDLGVSRVAMEKRPTATDLATLCAKHGHHAVQSLQLSGTAFDCGNNGFVYVTYDKGTFSTTAALKPALRRHGLNVK
ncbi:hypothetical protein [Ralstonia pseudosolanacearum]|uniref:hypothetical protein n=1 Tax=Ralstonia pseudosolanacearum TaxID=1310165 RepID=UPI00067612F2